MEFDDVTRREFVALAASAVMVARGRVAEEAEAAPRSGGSAPPPWYASMRRCGQLNLNERDPLTLDVPAWIDYWASLHIDALLINGGGILAFYPTTVPYHRRSEVLGARDVLGEVIAGCARRRIRVVARMDCNYAYEDAFHAHPEWFERNRDGSPRRHGEAPWLYKTCMFSTYFSEQMPAIYREIARRYPVDGFFTNGWPSTGSLTVCHCPSCAAVYRDEVGGVPPEHTDASSATYRRYYAVYMRRVVTVWEQWQAVVSASRPDVAYVGNLGGGIRTVKNLKTLGDTARWFNADHQGRSGDTPIWDCAQQGRVAQSVMHGRTITNVTGAYSNSRVTWRHTAKPPVEMTLWMAQTVASGMVPWFHWLGGQPEDQRWREVGRRFYGWLADHEPHFRNRRSIADIAVLYPQRTIAFYRSGPSAGGWGGGERGQSSEYLQGLYLALLEGRFLFDFVHEDDLTPATLSRYRALLIPNGAYFADTHCDQIRQYVANGGSLLATFETSRYGEWGDERAELGLGDVLGAHVAGATVGPAGNGYMRIGEASALTQGFEGTAILPGAESRVPVRATGSGAPLLTVVPNYPAFPPEMVWPRVARTDDPAVIVRESGGSRVIYFPGDVDRTLWRSGSADLSLLLQNAIHWVRGSNAPPVSVSGEGMAELFAWETEPGYALHLLNYDTPNMTRPFVRRLAPLGVQRVAFEVAPGRSITRVRALRANRPLKFSQTGRVVRFDVPSVDDYEVVALT